MAADISHSRGMCERGRTGKKNRIKKGREERRGGGLENERKETGEWELVRAIIVHWVVLPSGNHYKNFRIKHFFILSL